MWSRVRAELPGWRRGLRQWRRSRPFWGGLILALAGLELLWSSHLDLGASISAPGFEGFMSYLLPGIVGAAGVLSWFSPKQRIFYSIVAVITALYALIGLNVGGFFIGTALGVVGASLTFAWTPVPASVVPGAPVVPGAADPATDGPPPTPPDESRAASLDEPTAASPEGPGAAGPPAPRVEPRSPIGPKHLAGLIALVVVAAGLVVSAPTRAMAAPEVSGVAATPGTLTASKLDLSGFRYRGVVTVATPKGSVRVLKFTMDSSVLTNFGLVTTGAGGRRVQTTSGRLVVSGNVSMYTTKFSGKLLGLPLTFTPTFPPPLVLPTMSFTSVTSQLVLLRGDRLTAPTLRLHLIA